MISSLRRNGFQLIRNLLRRKLLSTGNIKIIALVLFIWILYQIIDEPLLIDQKIQKSNKEDLDIISAENENAGRKYILYWNSFHGIKDYTFGFGQHPFMDANCRVSNCFLTDDRTFFNRSHVVIFSIQGLDLNDLPVHRFPHQRFVFFEMESPANTDLRPVLHNKRTRHNFFNWTMTYRLDSDIVNRDSYGMTIPNERRQPVAYPDFTGFYRDKRRSVHLVNPPMVETVGKKKLVAWFVSNCQTSSRREEYVQQLSRYIQVDVYGRCGNLSCSDEYNCYVMLRNEYKFYLAFENSLCPDYVTEKLSRSLIFDVVPVVYGGVDYSLYAPPHSYINIRDFSSPKELAEYLLLLDRMDGFYARYFDWKRDYRIELAYRQSWCHLCALVNDEHLPPKVYPDIYQWWVEDGKCLKTKWSNLNFKTYE